MTCSSWTRRGEICALRWSDTYLDGTHEGCQLESRRVYINATMQRVEGELKRCHPRPAPGVAPYRLLSLRSLSSSVSGPNNSVGA